MTRDLPIRFLVVLAVPALLGAGCSDSSDPDEGTAAPTGDATVSPDESDDTAEAPADDPDATDEGEETAEPDSEPGPLSAQRPALNPFLAGSAVPIGHGDSAQSDWSTVTGPSGPSADLNVDDLVYQHLGPAHFGIAISDEYSDGRRVIWSNGRDRISKVDYDTLEVLAELPIADELLSAEQADAELAELDSLAGLDKANRGLEMAVRYLTGLDGIYYLLDVDNTLFVGGAESILAYGDVEPDNADSAIELVAEWPKPEGITGGFVGANLTFDGRIAMVTNEGWIVVVERDFSDYEAIQLNGAEVAPQHNIDMLDAGFRPGAADWVRNSLAIDEDGGIYAVSANHMHKVVWDGETLSTDPADGAWTEPYLNGTTQGSGATPSLMGFGDEDRFVVITDGEKLMNLLLFWRDEIPEGWEPLADAPSPRIAGQHLANIGDPTRESVQTDQSVVVAGYGAFVVNNDPASVPDGFPAAGTRVLSGYSGADPLFTPLGLQKFEWDEASQTFGEAWANTEISSANAVPIVSGDLGLVYVVGARDGEWTLEGVDWETGESVFHWVTGSNRYNTLFSGLNIDQDGRIVHTTMFGILRYDPQG